MDFGHPNEDFGAPEVIKGSLGIWGRGRILLSPRGCSSVGTAAAAWWGRYGGGPGPDPRHHSPWASVIWPFPSPIGVEITRFIYSCGLRAPVLLECDVSVETHQDAADLCTQAPDGSRRWVLLGG